MGRGRGEGQHGVKLEHVKITDGADVVKRVRAEKAAGRGDAEGTVDLVWINGENFATHEARGPAVWPLRRKPAQLRSMWM